MNLFNYLRTYLRAFVRNDEGQDLLEYALLVALIAIVCVIAIGMTGTNVNDIFVKIGDGARKRASVTGVARRAAECPRAAPPKWTCDANSI